MARIGEPITLEEWAASQSTKRARPLDVRERTRRFWADADREWMVSLISLVSQGDDSKQVVQEQVMVVAPGFEEAERIASAFGRVNEGRCDRYLVERLVKCAGGCGQDMAFYDPRPASGGPTVDEVLKGWKMCGTCVAAGKS